LQDQLPGVELGSPSVSGLVSHADQDDGQRKAVRNPIVWIPISGVLLSLAGIQLPHLLSVPVESPRAKSDRPPAILPTISTGTLSRCGSWIPARLSSTTVNIQTCTNISIKNLIQPAMMALAGLAFGLSHTPVGRSP
jgi:malonate transporter